MNTRSAFGLVLKTSDHGESDKLITLYSPDLGRATGIAKGAKRSKKRFVNKLEPFSLLRIAFRPSRGSSLLFIEEAELIEAHLPIRQQYRRYVAATYIGELVLLFTREFDPDPAIFTLLTWAVQALEDKHPPRIVTLFHLRLLTATGYQPELGTCSSCMVPVAPGKDFILLPTSGALLCSQCRHQRHGKDLTLSIQTLKFLATAQQQELSRLTRLQLPEKAVREALGVLYRYSRHLLQQDIHSWPALNRLLREDYLSPVTTSWPC